MSENLTPAERLEGLQRFLNVTQQHGFRFVPTAPWRMGDSEQNAAMARLYPADVCVEGFCANCALYLVVDLRYTPTELPWTVVRPCDEIRTDNNKHPRDAMRNDGRALVWAAHHGLSKMVDPASREHDVGAIRMQWRLQDEAAAASRR